MSKLDPQQVIQEMEKFTTSPAVALQVAGLALQWGLSWLNEAADQRKKIELRLARIAKREGLKRIARAAAAKKSPK
jgi:hypothetical protein